LARIVIAGCGDIGKATGALLVADGNEVFGIRRSQAAIAPGIELVAADLCEPDQLRSLPSAIDVLIYAAAADGFSDQAYERAYVIGLRNVLSAVGGGSLCRVIFVSSTSVYAQNDGAWVDEDSVTLPTGFSGQRLLQAEAMLAEESRAMGCVSSVVRFGGIYGPGRTRLLQQVRAGARCREEPVQWTNRIHRDDCAGVLRHVVMLEEPAALYLGVDSEPAGQCTVLRWLAREMGAPEPTLATQEDDSARRRRGGNKRCSNRRLLDSGYQFVYPGYRQGYAALLSAEIAERTSLGKENG
jgi:nucleoside-diphosphate-sugar epimerase